MVLRRVYKRTAYAAFALVAALAVVGVVVLLSGSGSSQRTARVTPTPDTFTPIEVGRVVVIPHTGSSGQTRTVDIVAELRNQNPRAGVRDYAVTFSIQNPAGEEITSTKVDTYILPGSQQYALALDVGLPAGEQLGQVKVAKPSDVQFLRLPEKLDLPQFSLFLQTREEQVIGDSVTQRQVGLVRNTGTLDWERVEVSAIAVDESGDIIAAGRTFVGRLLTGEQREFSLQWPKPTRPVSNVIAVPSTNIFREENVIKALGDPGTLR